MRNLFAGVVTVLVVLVVAGYVYLMTPPWTKKKLMDKAAVMIGRQVVEKSDCARIVEARVYEKPPFNSFPPTLIFTWYTNHVVLEDGRTRTFHSGFVYKVGQMHCNFWTEYVRNKVS